jgi:hypothetical protein
VPDVCVEVLPNAYNLKSPDAVSVRGQVSPGPDQTVVADRWLAWLWSVSLDKGCGDCGR